MSVTATAFVPCEKGDRYIKQLVSHWRHKLNAEYEEQHALVQFGSGAVAEFNADEHGITIFLAAPDEDENIQKRGVIERHIDRFAFREAPLSYSWQEQAA